MTTENQTAQVEKTAPRTQPVTISAVKQMLKDGKTRKEIGAEFGLNHKQLVALFQNPKLKGLKTHSKTELPFDLIDDEAITVAEDAPKADAIASEDSKATTTEKAPVQEEAGW